MGSGCCAPKLQGCPLGLRRLAAKGSDAGCQGEPWTLLNMDPVLARQYGWRRGCACGDNQKGTGLFNIQDTKCFRHRCTETSGCDFSLLFSTIDKCFRQYYWRRQQALEEGIDGKRSLLSGRGLI